MTRPGVDTRLAMRHARPNGLAQLLPQTLNDNSVGKIRLHHQHIHHKNAQWFARCTWKKNCNQPPSSVLAAHRHVPKHAATHAGQRRQRKIKTKKLEIRTPHENRINQYVGCPLNGTNMNRQILELVLESPCRCNTPTKTSHPTKFQSITQRKSIAIFANMRGIRLEHSNL